MLKSALYSLFAIILVSLILFLAKENTEAPSGQQASFATFTNTNNSILVEDDEQVGVFFMPSWNTSADPAKDRDSFWSCLTGRGDCSSLQNPGIWGPKGRIYNAKYPYEGPYLDRKPIKELKGFYKRDDPEGFTVGITITIWTLRLNQKSTIQKAGKRTPQMPDV